MGQRRSFDSIGDSTGQVRCFMAVLLAITGLGLALIAAPRPAGAQVCDGAVYEGVCFPQGDTSFADATAQLTRGPIGDSPNGDTTSPLGAPNDPTSSGGPIATPNSVSLGNGGVLVVQFTDNILTGSGTQDADLWIFEAGGQEELAFVAVSSDGASWTSLGRTSSQTAGFDLDAAGFGPSAHLFYVRVTDDPDDYPSAPTNNTGGADIDAVGAITTIPAPTGTCNGLEPTITGAGEIEGSSAHEVILGSPGDDVITGSSGHDTICGGGGNDYINGNSGNDWISGSGTLIGDSGNDVIIGTGEIIGDSGNDLITAESGDSTIDGGSGNDTCSGTEQIVDCER